MKAGSTAEEVFNAIIQREVACLEKFHDFPRDRQQGIFNGPGGYRPTTSLKKSVLEDVRQILRHIIPRDDAYTASILWHNDLHLENIFVDETQPT